MARSGSNRPGPCLAGVRAPVGRGRVYTPEAATPCSVGFPALSPARLSPEVQSASSSAAVLRARGLSSRSASVASREAAAEAARARGRESATVRGGAPPPARTQAPRRQGATPCAWSRSSRTPSGSDVCAAWLLPSTAAVSAYASAVLRTGLRGGDEARPRPRAQAASPLDCCGAAETRAGVRPGSRGTKAASARSHDVGAAARAASASEAQARTVLRYRRLPGSPISFAARREERA